jgi:predicted nucleic acid-binding protein
MKLYVDSSALVKRYVEESDSARIGEILTSATGITSARHTLIETARAIVRALDAADSRTALANLDADWSHFAICELDMATCNLAREFAIETNMRTLDALHLAAMWRIGGDDTKLLTTDVRQARAARALGLPLA